MTTSRRAVFRYLLATPPTLLIARSLPAADEPPSPGEKALFGPWFVSVGQVSIIISIEPAGQALVVFDEKGAITIGRHGWRALPGGLLVDTLPRFRLWHVADFSENCEVRVQMESLPDQVEISNGIRNFPRRFCMKRIDHAPLPRALAERPLPQGWDSEKPPE